MRENRKDNIIFRNHGAIEHKKLGNYYNNFDLFIFPTKNESLGLVALEALACGTPIIGTDIPITKLYIKDGFNGFIYKSGDIDSLVKCIKKYFKLNSNSKNEMQLNARATSLNFEHNKVTIELINQYKKIVQKK